MRVISVARRAAALARGASEQEAVANLAAGYETMMRTAAVALEEGDARAAARFRRKAMHYFNALRAAALGVDVIELYARVTGSRPWSGR